MCIADPNFGLYIPFSTYQGFVEKWPRSMQETYKMNLIIPKSQGSRQRLLRSLRRTVWRGSHWQRWDNWSSLEKKPKNNCNASTHIKYVEVHEFIMILGMGKENMDAADRWVSLLAGSHSAVLAPFGAQEAVMLWELLNFLQEPAISNSNSSPTPVFRPPLG